MTWWNPKSWFSGAPAPEDVALPELPTLPDSTPFVWVQIRPENPHMGLDFYSDAEFNPYEHAIRVKDITPSEARAELVGKVLDWTRFTPEHLALLESGAVPTIPHATLKAMYR